MPSYGAELSEAHASVHLDWTGFHGMPFWGGALAPAGKPQPLLHAGPHSTSNSINAAKATAGKPQPVFHAGSYLMSNSINVAQAVVQELQRLWKERWWKRQGTPARPCLGKSECL